MQELQHPFCKEEQHQTRLSIAGGGRHKLCFRLFQLLYLHFTKQWPRYRISAAEQHCVSAPAHWWTKY